MEANTWEMALAKIAAEQEAQERHGYYQPIGDSPEFGEYESFEHIYAHSVAWLWYPYIPRGKVTILQGDPGEGKTTLAIHLAAMLSRGEIYAEDGSILRTGAPESILLESAEDGLEDTIKPRLNAAKADPKHIFHIYTDEVPLTLRDERLANFLRVKRPALAILDPLQAYLGDGVDMHRANEIRPIMAYLSRLAEETETAIVLIGHMNKRAGDRSMYRGLGSIDITAAARSVLVMARDPKAENQRILMQVKSSLAPQGKPMAFEIGEHSRMELQGVYEGDVEKLLLADSALSSQSSLNEAIEFLTEFLANGECRSDAVLEAAKERGIAKVTLSRAKKKLHIRSEKRGAVWYFVPPTENLPAEEEEDFKVS